MATRIYYIVVSLSLWLISPLNAFAMEMKTVSINALNVSIELPDSFTEMPDNWAKIKYPSKNRPQVIYSDESGSVSFGISKKDKPDLIHLDEIKDAMLKSMNRFNPQALPLTVDGYNAWLITFKSKAIDSEILNMQLITITDRDFVIATFNMNTANIEKYKIIGINSLSSMEFK